MKVKYLLGVLLAGGFMTSCSDNDEAENRGVDQTGETASISVRLVGNNPAGRATETGTTEENAVKNFGVYVFNESGVLEDYKEDIVSSTLETTIAELSTGTKNVVVFANLGIDKYPVVLRNSTTLAALEAEINLNDQNGANITTKGFVMGGKKETTLIKGDNEITMSIERAVAKIIINAISIDMDTEAYPGAFEITDVHIMKAMPLADIKAENVTGKKGASDLLYGGMVGTASTVQQDYLTNQLVTPVTIDASVDNAGFVYYVFPNTVYADATLLTFEGTYNGEPVYFPFRINEIKQGDGDGTGELLKPNTVHKVSVVFKNPGTGRDNPEQAMDLADLDVKVEIAGWSVIPTHNLEW